MVSSELIGSTFESSLRILILLDELQDYKLDELQIACIDFISIYAADFNLLDENLHGYGLFRHSEFSSKLKLASLSLKSLVLKSLVNFYPDTKGYLYLISHTGKEVVKQINNAYSDQYRIAIQEVVCAFPSLDENQMEKQIFKLATASLEKNDE